jgi:demethylmenaquinone methyltransferase/2-methoxy-6-polyprenyl-1,4-benzoquinol methylase
MPDTPQRTSATPRRVWGMFDRIAHRYDMLNHVLSFRRDIAWRKRTASHLADAPDQVVLDLATGTADLLIALHETGRVKQGVGMDMSSNMLLHGERKIEALGMTGALALREGDATEIPEPDAVYDAVSIAFGIRNVGKTEEALREMLRVLKPGGRALILEFSIPSNPIVRFGYLVYLRHLLPRVGGLISGDSEAYRYLNRTIELFPHGDAFLSLMRRAGFDNPIADPVTFGVASIYRGEKPR